MLLQPQGGVLSCLSCTNFVPVWSIGVPAQYLGLSRSQACKVAVRSRKNKGLQKKEKSRGDEKGIERGWPEGGKEIKAINACDTICCFILLPIAP